MWINWSPTLLGREILRESYMFHSGWMSIVNKWWQWKDSSYFDLPSSSFTLSWWSFRYSTQFKTLLPQYSTQIALVTSTKLTNSSESDTLNLLDDGARQRHSRNQLAYVPSSTTVNSRSWTNEGKTPIEPNQPMCKADHSFRLDRISWSPKWWYVA